MSDLISRQAAIDAVNRALDRETLLNRLVRKVAIDAIRIVPTVQPNQNADVSKMGIIHCKDCRFWKKYKYFNGKPTYAPFCGFNSIFTDDNDFCSRAEKRGEAE
jgi:hypothetical protein